jgi:hypothetical protein
MYKLGTTRLRVQERRDAVVLLCGPLAEKDWPELAPGTQVQIETVRADQEGLLYLATQHGDLQPCVEEALLFITQPAVQDQIDRVARALVERVRLTDDEVREAAGFFRPLRSPGW